MHAGTTTQMAEPVLARRGSATKMAAVQDSEKLGNRAEADALGALKVQYCELPADMVDFIVQSAQKGLKAQFKGEKNFYYEVAESIKKEVEQKYGGTWHCIVGRHFGSFVSYEVKSIAYFFLGPTGVLCFKHG